MSLIYATGKVLEPIAVQVLPVADPVRTFNLLTVSKPVPPYNAVTAVPVHVPLWFAVTVVAPILPALAFIVINDVAPIVAVPETTSLIAKNEVPAPVNVVTFVFCDRPELVEDTANPALVDEIANPALVEDTANPALVEETASPALVEEIANPALVDETASPALVEEIANPALVDETASPALVEDTAKPALVAVVALPENVVAVIVFPSALTPDKTYIGVLPIELLLLEPVK